MPCKKFTLLILTLALAALILSGCSSKLADIELPPLPTPTVKVSAPPATYVPKVTPTPTPTPTPSQSPEPTPTPAPIVTPAVEETVREPAITVTDVTLPEDMAQYNVAMLHGWISVQSGVITEVYASISDETGNIVQESLYTPYEMQFSLAGTVNADLAFAHLTPGTYDYQVTVTAESGENANVETVISTSFIVYSGEKPSGEKAQVNYTTKLTDEETNEGLIWNFFVEKLGNPYGAAAVLANMRQESVCTPQRVSGDMATDFAFSLRYTELVDSGDVNRDSFIQAAAGNGYGNAYGLCQWQGERKAGLYDLAKGLGTSVGDLITQCEYTMIELQVEYPSLLSYLKTANDCSAAARQFCYVFEQASITGDRAVFAKEYLDKFAA